MFNPYSSPFYRGPLGEHYANYTLSTAEVVATFTVSGLFLFLVIVYGVTTWLVHLCRSSTPLTLWSSQSHGTVTRTDHRSSLWFRPVTGGLPRVLALLKRRLKAGSNVEVAGKVHRVDEDWESNLCEAEKGRSWFYPTPLMPCPPPQEAEAVLSVTSSAPDTADFTESQQLPAFLRTPDLPYRNQRTQSTSSLPECARTRSVLSAGRLPQFSPPLQPTVLEPSPVVDVGCVCTSCRVGFFKSLLRLARFRLKKFLNCPEVYATDGVNASSL